MVQHGADPLGVRAASLERDGGLADGGHHVFATEGVESDALPSPDTEAAQPGGGEHGGVGDVVLADLAQAGVHVAPNLGVFRVGEQHRELQTAARAAGGDERGRLDPVAQDEDVARVLARQVTGHGQPGGQFARQVLAAVDGDVGLAAQQGLLEFFGEQTFATLLFERPLDALVAGGDDLEQLGFPAERGAQVRRDLFGLGERKRALAGGKGEFGHGKGARSEETGARIKRGRGHYACGLES